MLNFGVSVALDNREGDTGRSPSHHKLSNGNKIRSKPSAKKDRNGKEKGSKSHNHKEQYDGARLEFGFSVGNQKTAAKSRDFADSPATVNAVRYGGNVGVGYSVRISNNFSAGINVGVDGNFWPSKMWRGRGLSANSSIKLKNSADSKKDFDEKRSALRNFFRTVHEVVQTQKDRDLEKDNFEGLVNFCHWLGSDKQNNYIEFPTDLRDGNDEGVWGEVANIGITAGTDEKDRIKAGFEAVKSFSINNFPTVSKALATLAKGNEGGYSVLSSEGQTLIENGDLKHRGTELIYGLFSGFPAIAGKKYFWVGSSDYLIKASQLFPKDTFPEDPDCKDDSAITKDESQLSYALKAINDLYYNTKDSDEDLLKYRKLNNNEEDSEINDGENSAEREGGQNSISSYKFRSKTKFDLCPHITVQFGYFIKELGGILYTKLGAMELNGRTTIATDVSDVYVKRFRKWTPYAALGFNKSLSETWGVSVEAGHAFKISKKFDIKYGDDVIKEKISVNRSTFKVMFTCNLGRLMDMD